MTQPDPYAAFREQPNLDKLKDLAGLVNDLLEAQSNRDRLERELEEADRRVRMLSDVVIPEVMEAVPTTRFDTPNGWVIELNDHIDATVLKDRRAEAHKWLDDHGHGGLIKRTVLVAFNRDQAEQAAELAGKLRGDYSVAVETKVEPSTFKAWVKGQLKAGAELPDELFSIFQAKRAKATPPKTK